jgi:catechol 2,3-dioxygenase-like lactoylglutathione lyase family enzyme
MLANSMITTMLPVRDADRAGRFYADTLGLHLRETGPDGTLIFDAGRGDAIGLRPLPDAQPSDNTALSFEVADIVREVAELESRGVCFQDFDSGDLKTENHVATMGNEKAAWFADSEGNVLCIHQVTN